MISNSINRYKHGNKRNILWNTNVQWCPFLQLPRNPSCHDGFRGSCRNEPLYTEEPRTDTTFTLFNGQEISSQKSVHMNGFPGRYQTTTIQCSQLYCILHRNISSQKSVHMNGFPGRYFRPLTTVFKTKLWSISKHRTLQNFLKISRPKTIPCWISNSMRQLHQIWLDIRYYNILHSNIPYDEAAQESF